MRTSRAAQAHAVSIAFPQAQPGRPVTIISRRSATVAIGRAGSPFFLRGLAEVSVQAAETARKILESRGAHRRNITEHLGRAAGNRHRVLERLYERPDPERQRRARAARSHIRGRQSDVQRLMDLKIL